MGEKPGEASRLRRQGLHRLRGMRLRFWGSRGGRCESLGTVKGCGLYPGDDIGHMEEFKSNRQMMKYGFWKVYSGSNEQRRAWR